LKAKRKGVVLACVLAVLAAVRPAAGQEIDTLEKIKATNAITIGHRDVAVPFSYLDAKRQPIGYSMDLCMRIVDAVKASLKMPRLDVKLQPVTAGSRFPLLANGTIDIECGSTTNTVERQQQVSFLVTTFVTATRFAWKKSAKFTSVNDLKDKTVVAVAGTTNVRLMNEINNQRGLRTTIVPAKHYNDAFDMLDKGQAAAFLSSDILIYGLIASSASPADFAVSNDALGARPYGITVRKDDKAFKKVADDAIRALFKSGEINKIYAKWFSAPIPPKNIALNIPMSDALKKVIAKPTDSGHPNDY
jgi:glutamate/aspartate transport system substrate-binding protein